MQTMRRSPGTPLRLTHLLFPVLLAAQLGGGALSRAGAASWGIAPDLDLVLRTTAPDELVPVTIVMAEQADVERLLPIAKRLRRAERRQFAAGELKHVAASTQGRVRGFLAAAQARGEAADVRGLWIANGVSARLTSQTVRELLRFDEIRTILWDPPLAPGQAEDVTEPVAEPVAASPGWAGAGGDPQIWWQLTYVHAPEVWALGYRGEGIVVAIQDSGVDRTHPDLSTHIWSNPGEIPANSLDDDQNGYIDDTWGWDFESNDNNPSPGISHGTNCAGIVAGDGTAGIATGVAPGALLMSCKVNTWSQNLAGIQYAIDNGADVISMSRSEKWRFIPKPDYDWWRSNTDNELLAGIFHANSIGNEGDNQNTDPIPFNIAAPGSCPAPWRHPDQVQAGVSGIIGCGAVDKFDVIAVYSSIGPFAWEDIRAHWPEYPFNMRSEYRDYPWWGGLTGLVKPDIVAPGPDTRATQPGGGYIVFSGTSAATPHVAGAMALCIQANPDLTPEQMARVLQTTAGDLGSAGKDNTFGAGKLNCYESVLAALAITSFGTVKGTVLDATTDLPVNGVLVEVVGESESALTNSSGYYELSLAANDYTLRFTQFYYEEATAQVTVLPETATTLDILLSRRPAGGIAGTVTAAGNPDGIPGVAMAVEGSPIPGTTTGPTGSYSFSTVPAASYDVSASVFGYVPATQPVTVLAQETAVLDFSLTPALVALNLETDPGWQVGAPGDNATGGIWVRVDPVGTAAQTENDHTTDPGVLCFVTGQGVPGGPIDAADVDGGTTSLRTGLMDLSTTTTAVVSYWRWYSNNQGGTFDDRWVVQISSNGGSTWVDLERTNAALAAWTYREFVVADYVDLTSQVMVKFVASDLGATSVVEAAVDDFQVFGDPAAAAVGDPPATSALRLDLAQNQPNPFNPATTIGFVLPGAGEKPGKPVTLSIYDVSGRLVRNLIHQPLAAGKHAIEWDGRDARGLSTPSGIYLYRLTASGVTLTRRMVLLK